MRQITKQKHQIYVECTNGGFLQAGNASYFSFFVLFVDSEELNLISETFDS